MAKASSVTSDSSRKFTNPVKQDTTISSPTVDQAISAAPFTSPAVACLKHNAEFKALYDRKVSQGKTAKQALICVAKKLAHLCLSMLKSGESYNPSRVFMPA